MLYIYDKIDLLEDEFLEDIIPLLSETRLDKIKRLRSVQSKKVSAIAYLLLRIALLENHNIMEAVEFEYIGNGKPILRDYPQIHFNLSHSQNTAACVIADSTVGVDVQKTKKVSDKVAKRVLTADEYAAFLSSCVPDEYFCEIWTIKESYLKKTGQGIAAELRDIKAAGIDNKAVTKGNGFFCCVCGSVAMSPQPLEIKYIGREDFGKLSN